jgi:hypothetical protein
LIELNDELLGKKVIIRPKGELYIIPPVSLWDTGYIVNYHKKDITLSVDNNKVCIYNSFMNKLQEFYDENIEDIHYFKDLDALVEWQQYHIYKEKYIDKEKYYVEMFKAKFLKYTDDNHEKLILKEFSLMIRKLMDEIAELTKKPIIEENIKKELQLQLKTQEEKDTEQIKKKSSELL